MRKYLTGFALAILCAGTASAATMVTIINNTDAYGTAYAKISLCSSIVPKGEGIIKPHSTRTADISPVKILCQDKDCDAHVFLSKDCSGKQFAKVVINANKGIVSVTNYDKVHYNISLTGNTVQVDPV